MVSSESRTTDGVWITAEPCIRLPTDCSSAELGKAALAALATSKTGVAHPTDWKGVVQPLLMATGVKSWSALAKIALCVAIEASTDGMVLVPTHNLGGREGYEPKTELAVRVNRTASAATLGTALRDAFEDSQ